MFSDLYLKKKKKTLKRFVHFSLHFTNLHYFCDGVSYEMSSKIH